MQRCCLQDLKIQINWLENVSSLLYTLWYEFDILGRVNFDLPSSFQHIRGLFIELLLWTGIKKGPPRKLKFPDNTDLIEEVKKKL